MRTKSVVIHWARRTRKNSSATTASAAAGNMSQSGGSPAVATQMARASAAISAAEGPNMNNQCGRRSTMISSPSFRYFFGKAMH